MVSDNYFPLLNEGNSIVTTQYDEDKEIINDEKEQDNVEIDNDDPYDIYDEEYDEMSKEMMIESALDQDPDYWEPSCYDAESWDDVG